MKVIPVIDILNGLVVHAVKGKRKEYKPVESALFKSIQPIDAAKALRELGFTELYIADLDAIIDCSSSFQSLKAISDQTDIEMMVDAGVTNIQRAQKLFDLGVSKLVVGTETLQSKHFVAQAVDLFGSNSVIVSLDLKGDKILVKIGFDGCPDSMCLLRDFKQMGISQVIVLDLLRVGSGEGVNIDLLKRIINEVGIDVYVGGGVRDLQDLLDLKRLGVKGALVATALHSGKITVEDLKREDLL
jgi:phosphoribosylformimino-5-aminoimidazole carboxamide ribotide isomerase